MALAVAPLGSDAAERQHAANIERALYTEAAQLEHALGQLKPRSGKAINLYFLGVAGDGRQEVFRREIDFVRAQFETTFGARQHAVSLINSRNTIGSVPLATVTSIRKAVAAIAAKMDKERDILFLYLTSHGSQKGALTLALNGISLPDLSAAQLAALLKEAGMRWKVIVISACYSGTFIEPLKDPGTLVITAARADRTSFGCADENDFTYFGRAFFKESLPAAKSFEDAFARASALVRQWEDADNAGAGKTTAEERHSLPQMAAPEAIRQHLKEWRADLATARPTPP
ncbi:MAG: C13 family peptidase [Desulfobulbus sp.]|nr:C13 family peptidase [Desulfobulbus sp.]